MINSFINNENYDCSKSSCKAGRESNMTAFLYNKGVSLSAREYFITALSYMALGLFSSLIIGLIMKTAGEQLEALSYVKIGSMFVEMGSFEMDSKIISGTIGHPISSRLKEPLLLFSSDFLPSAFTSEHSQPTHVYHVV